jgi:hypothetical protein
LETARLDPQLRNWARATLRLFFNGAPIVGLHLKQVTGYLGDSPISLANESVWFEFLSEAAEKFEIKFLLLGSDPVSKNIQILPNVCLAQEIGADSFGKHLALLSECNCFMGMMSAICNLALFSDLPYCIFKNPDHHRLEMLAEIGSGDRYPFATPFQKVIRENETPERLLSELVSMPFAKAALKMA